MTARSVSDLAATAGAQAHTFAQNEARIAAVDELVARLEAAEAQVAALTQERDETLDIPGAEAGWDGATTEWQRRAETAEAALADTRRALEDIEKATHAGVALNHIGWVARRALAATDGGTGQEQQP